MQSDNRPLLIGITGTFGSGKSTFCRFIEQVYPVIYSDQLAHDVLNDEEVIRELTSRWGNGIIVDGKPDRKQIGEIVFHNKTELDFLNSLIHPRVLQRMQKIVETSQREYLFFEIPLLFEAKLESCFDYIVLLTVSSETRMSRVQLRDKIDCEEINARVRSQLPENIKTSLADTVIHNDSTLDELKKQTTAFLASLAAMHRKSILRFY